MTTATKTLSAAWAPAALGPGVVYLTFLDYDGFFTIHNSVDPAAIVTGHPLPKNEAGEVSLDVSEYLHIKGRGTASVSAANPV